MTRACVFLLISLIALVLSGCQTHESYINGQTDIVEIDWKPQIHLNRTTEKEIVDLLGQPAGYYHRVPNNDEMYLFYHATSTLSTRHHLPFLPNAQFASHSKATVTRVWFLISKGVFTEQLESCEDPDLTNFILSPSSEFPYGKCNKTKTEAAKRGKGVFDVPKDKGRFGSQK